MSRLRFDQALICDWIRPGSRVLDLGCGDGALLKSLQEEKQVEGYGIEIEPLNVARCIRAGVSVIQTDLDRGLSEFEPNSFDYVIMSQTLQAVHHPVQVLEEILRVGRQGIVTFPNFGHWKCRLHLGLRGRMPMSRALPYMWYDTPNIRLCTVRDFERLCEEKQIRVLEHIILDRNHRSSVGIRTLPNLLGEIALYRFQPQTDTSPP